MKFRLTILLILFLITAQPAPAQNQIPDSILAITYQGNLRGTGFIFAHGVVTANHVADSGDLYIGYFPSGRMVPLIVVKRSKTLDVCFMTPAMEQEDWEMFFPGLKDPVLGEDLLFVGNGSLPFSVSKGIVSHVSFGPEFAVDFHVFPGDSGAPVFNTDGVLVGMVQGFYWEKIDENMYPGLAYCCSARALAEFVFSE